MDYREVGIAALRALSVFNKVIPMQNVAPKVFKPTLFILAFAFCWCEPLLANAIGSVSATAARVSWQHTSLTAHPYTGFGGKKYRACAFEANGDPIDCKNTDQQFVVLDLFETGKYYNIKVYCYCRGTGRLASTYKRTILDMAHHQVTPAAPAPPRIVRLRSAKSGMCLYAVSTDFYLRSLPCGVGMSDNFAIEDAPDGGTQIRNIGTGTCIYGGFPNLPDLRTGACGKYGTVVWVMNANSTTVFRLNILSTEDAVFGYPPARGPGGCVIPSEVPGGQATKGECTWGGDLSDVFYLDPQ
jgi:hypothetical protein